MTPEQEKAVESAKLRTMTPEQRKAVEAAKARLSVPQQEADWLDKFYGSHVGDFVTATAEPILNLTARGAAFLGDDTGLKHMEEFRQRRDRGREAQGRSEVSAPQIAGNVLSPLTFATGGPVKTVAGRILQGGGTGMLLSQATPVEGDLVEDSVTKAIIGGTIGLGTAGTMEALKPIGKAAHATIEPVTQKGRAAILRRYQESISPEGSIGKIVNALKKATPHVPGSNPTAAQALADLPEATGIAAHQKAISSVPPFSSDFVKRGIAQRGAREAAIGTIAKDGKALKKAISARKAATDPLYEAVRVSTKKVQARPVLNELDIILKENKNTDAIAIPLKAIRRKLISKKGLEANPKALVSLSDDIRNMLGRKIPGGTNEFDVKSLTRIKTILDDQIGIAEPAYAKAREEFRRLSTPINQMEVGGQLKEGLTTALESGKERAAIFGSAVRNAPNTIKKATGFRRFDSLDKILNPQQMKVVESIVDDLGRDSRANLLSKATRLPGATGIVEDSVKLPNLLSRPAMIANAILRRFGHGADDKINELAAQQYLDPLKLADALSGKIPDSKIMKVVNAIAKEQNQAIAGITFSPHGEN